MSAPPPSRLDLQQILQRSFDGATGKLRVDAAVSATIGTLAVEIDAADGDTIAISDGVNNLTINPDGSLDVNTSIDHTNDSIKIGDGTDLLAVNTDGSINVNVVSSTSTAYNFRFGEVSSVAFNILTPVLSYTATADSLLQRILVSGTNISMFEVVVNGNMVARKYTYYGNLNETFDLGAGIKVLSGQTILVRTRHNRPDVADFNATIQFTE